MIHWWTSPSGSKGVAHDWILAAQRRPEGALPNLKLDELPISAYNKRYLGEKIKNVRGSLSICGGRGVLSFMAKELGIDTVIYCDIIRCFLQRRKNFI